MTTPSAAGPTAVETGAAGADHGTSGPSAGGGFAGSPGGGTQPTGAAERIPAAGGGSSEVAGGTSGSGVSATGTRAVSAAGSEAGTAYSGCAPGSGGGSPSAVCQLISVSLVRCPSILAARRGSQADGEPAETLCDEQDAEQHEKRGRDVADRSLGETRAEPPPDT